MLCRIGQDHSEEIARRAGIGPERSPLDLAASDIDSSGSNSGLQASCRGWQFPVEAAFDRKTGAPALLSVWGLSGLSDEYVVRRLRQPQR